MPLIYPMPLACIQVQSQADSFDIRGVTVFPVSRLVNKLNRLGTLTRQSLVAAIQDEYKTDGYPLAVVTV